VLAPDVVIVEIVAKVREDTLAVLSDTLAILSESTVVLLPEATFDVLSERVDVSLVLERFGNDVESEPP
jgi:hypothetical protein